MWYLEAFDNETEFRTEKYLLHDMTAEIVKEILGIDDNNFDLPVVARFSCVQLDKVLKFAKYTHEPIDVIKNCEYFVGLFAD
ncbi:hypothetical protein C7T36_20395 [Rhodococcus sp. AD45-ID]|uniref:DUF7683 domain-containing protein n=1 Tax=unclassified Rhodococcus (in: high G+C Gram-positive bacteria) TaxID=192944 RepID=UPI0005D2EFE2|nr:MULTISPECIES: hypothetical protein [unclassified Rhodococcus (in: high G+C Gram-positive bacteria)]KJF22349.1 hypothetical protein SZ00_02997 [Rhodococcus sp. AD45]PSR39990.1 hypothetical protein C7T36_20395 [Rhodococcus sp. AD45-ID]